MSNTYGQLKDGEIIPFTDFFNSVSSALKAVGIAKCSPIKIRTEYEKGKSIEDTISLLIMMS